MSINLSDTFLQAAAALVRQEETAMGNVDSRTARFLHTLSETTELAWVGLKKIAADQGTIDDLKLLKNVKGEDQRLEQLWTAHAAELNDVLLSAQKGKGAAAGV